MSPKLKKFLQITLLGFFGVVIAVLVLEFGFRFYLHHFATEEQRILYLYSRDELNQIASRFVGKPYINYGLNENYGDHNSLGYRGEEISLEKPDDVFRIVALGGSTTYGVGIKDAENTYPAQLRDILREQYGYSNVEVINAGVPSYTTWESAVNLSFRVLDLDPDMLIIYHAVNDINPRIGDPEYYDGLNSGRGGWKGVQDEVPISSLYRLIATRLGWQPAIDSLDAKFNPPELYESCGVEFREDGEYCRNYEMTVKEVLERNPPTYFERNLRTMIAVAEAYDIEVMLSTWAYSPLRYDILGGDFMLAEFRQQAVAEHNQIIRDLAQETGLPMIDLAETMPEEAQYWVDGLHVNELGAEEQASQYAEFIDEQGFISTRN